MLKIRRIALLLAILFAFTGISAFAAPSDYDSSNPANLAEDYLYGESALIMDAMSGEILFSKNSRVRMYPASTTKIMTALLALESGWSLDTLVTIPAGSTKVPGDSSLVPVYVGETMTFGDLLYGLMLHSGNDAAMAIAILVSGSVDSFVERMNRKADEIGCQGTHFTNPHGYHDTNHYTTAYDLALMTQEALNYPEFREITSTRSYIMNVSQRGAIQIYNSNMLLVESSAYYYPDCIGVKTGTTNSAGNCFVGAVEKDGVELITVSLNCPQDEQRWVDTIRMFNFGYTCYSTYSLEQMFDAISDSLVTARVSNAADDDPYEGVLQLKIIETGDVKYERLIRNNNASAMDDAKRDFLSRSVVQTEENLSAPITEGQIVGTFTYTTQDGGNVTATLVAGRDIAERPNRMSLYDVLPFMRVFENRLVLILAAVVVLLIVCMLLYRNAKRKSEARRRKKLYEQRKRAYRNGKVPQKRTANVNTARKTVSSKSTASAGKKASSTAGKTNRTAVRKTSQGGKR